MNKIKEILLIIMAEVNVKEVVMGDYKLVSTNLTNTEGDLFFKGKLCLK